MNLLISDPNTPEGVFFCNQLQSCINMTSYMNEPRSEIVNLLFDRLISSSSKLLLKHKKILNADVQFYFKTEDEIFAFIKQLLYRFLKITAINGFVVRYFSIIIFLKIPNFLYLYSIIVNFVRSKQTLHKNLVSFIL